MGNYFVTGSADGIGLETARTLADAGHRVVAHARSGKRAGDIRATVPAVAGVAVGDASVLAEIRAVAEQASDLGPYDAVIHNVGVGSLPRSTTPDGLETIFTVNVLAPYLLTALMPAPPRLIYLTSGLEASGRADLDDLLYERKPWNGMSPYADSKLYDVMLAFAVARRWPQVLSNAVDPGWIKTRMGGDDAPGELAEGADTQVWLATSDEPDARVTGRYLYRRGDRRANPAAYDVGLQEGLLAACAKLAGVTLPD